MASNLYPPPRPLSVGETLDLAFRIFRATLITCLLYAGLAVIAIELANVYTLSAARARVPLLGMRDLVSLLPYGAAWLVLAILGSVIVLRQYAVLGGRSPDARTELGTVARRLPELLLVWILISVASAIWFLPMLALHGANRLTRGLAAAALSIPAGYFAILLSCAWPVFLLSGAAAVASLTHSRSLVQGNWWRVAALYTVGLTLLLILCMVFAVVAVAVALPFAGGDLAVTTAIAGVIATLLTAAGIPFLTALMLAIYGDLLVRREGADLGRKLAAAG